MSYRTLPSPRPPAACWFPLLTLALTGWGFGRTGAEDAPTTSPVRVLIITGDTHSAHDWKTTTPALVQVLTQGNRIETVVTTTPSTDLTAEKLARFDVLLLNYYDFTKPDKSPATTWTDANKAALLKAVHDDGKGLVLIHHASGAFTTPNWVEFEQAVGGWRKQGFHGPAHEFTVKPTAAAQTHPVGAEAPGEFAHRTDELYQNCLVPPGAVVLATAYSDPAKPKGTGRDEAVIWANSYGKGRVFEDVLGHDVAAITDPGAATWLRRGVLWAAQGTVPAAVK